MTSSPGPVGAPTSYRRLYRSRFSRIFAGVCGGFAEYMNLDPTIVRIIFVLFLLVNFWVAVVLYIIAIFLIPETPFGMPPPTGVSPGVPHPTPYVLEAALLAVGGLIAAVGLLTLLFNLGLTGLNPFAVFDLFNFTWPVLIILLGIAIIVAVLMRPRRRL